MSKKFDRLLDKATDSILVDSNWEAIMECVNLVRSGEAPVKSAVASIQKRCHNTNPHVAHHALVVLEACMKNCGARFHAEVATKDFMEDLKNLSLDAPDKVKNKILELLQCWVVALKNKPECKIIVDTHNLMKLAGFDFPKVAEADAMFIAESAPVWMSGDECFRCRTAFGLITRKHHCRACGQIFCDKCSSKQSFLPQFGIEKEVRVCDGCYEKASVRTKSDSIMSSDSVILGQPTSIKTGSSLTLSAKQSAEMGERDLQQAEEDEINLAIALSQSEAEAKAQEKQRGLYQMYSAPASQVITDDSQERKSVQSIYKGAATAAGFKLNEESTTENDLISPELTRYLNKDYWQQRRSEQSKEDSKDAMDAQHQSVAPSAPPRSESSHSRQTHMKDDALVSSFSALSMTSTTKELDVTLNSMPLSHFSDADEEETAETMEFCRQLREQVSIMDNRIRSNLARNRSIVNDSAIQSLFVRLTDMHTQVMSRMNNLDDQRAYFESLQDNLAHIQEARQAVDALREDHERQKQEMLLEGQRLRQKQMQEKVDLMRQKKQELLLQQRLNALIRFQQQESQRKMRSIPMQQQIESHMAPAVATCNDFAPQYVEHTDAYQTIMQPYYAAQKYSYQAIPQPIYVNPADTGYMPNAPVYEHYSLSSLHAQNGGVFPAATEDMNMTYQNQMNSAPHVVDRGTNDNYTLATHTAAHPYYSAQFYGQPAGVGQHQHMYYSENSFHPEVNNVQNTHSHYIQAADASLRSPAVPLPVFQSGQTQYSYIQNNPLPAEQPSTLQSMHPQIALDSMHAATNVEQYVQRPVLSQEQTSNFNAPYNAYGQTYNGSVRPTGQVAPTSADEGVLISFD